MRLAEKLAPQEFGGSTYEPKRDAARLSRQLSKVRNLMLDGKHRTIREICVATQITSEASVSARLRDMRKTEFGGYDVQKENIGGGVWLYWANP